MGDRLAIRCDVADRGHQVVNLVVITDDGGAGRGRAHPEALQDVGRLRRPACQACIHEKRVHAARLPGIRDQEGQKGILHADYGGCGVDVADAWGDPRTAVYRVPEGSYVGRTSGKQLLVVRVQRCRPDLDYLPKHRLDLVIISDDAAPARMLLDFGFKMKEGFGCFDGRG